MGEKELSDSSSINVFCARAINYPLTKPMVYHDHDRVKPMGIGQSSDEVDKYGGEGEGRFDGQW